MERTSLKRNAKSIGQFVQACLFPQAFVGTVLEPCVSFVNAGLQERSHRSYIKLRGSDGCKNSFKKQQKLGSTALILSHLGDLIHSHTSSILIDMD